MPSCERSPVHPVVARLEADPTPPRRTVQLLATAILSSISFFSESYKNWIWNNQWMMWVSLFGAIGFMVRTPLSSRTKSGPDGASVPADGIRVP